MDTDSIRLFVLAAEKLNISAAGTALGLAPAVASARLAKLEKNLGADLLHRSTRKVSLSLEGAEFLPYAREILAQEGAARAALGLDQASATGTLRFAAPSTFAQQYITPLLPHFLDLHPDLNLDMRFSDSQFDLIEGSFDLALRNAALSDSSFKARRLAGDQRVLCAAQTYLNKFGTPFTPQDLTDHQLIAFKDLAPRPLVSGNGQSAQFDPRRSNCRLIVDDGLSQKRATIAGAGISSNSLWSVHAELKSGELQRVLPDYTVDDQSALWLVYPKSNVLTAKTRIFIDYLLEQIGDPPIWETTAT